MDDSAHSIKERPILFSAPMVRAILEGRKVVTRRVVKIATPKALSVHDWSVDGIRVGQCPYGQPGDQLWVRETWGQLYPLLCDDEPVFWRADYSDEELSQQLLPKWRPSIHMYRWASRITLEVTGVRVERLQDITREGAAAEGMCMGLDGPLPDWFRRDRWPEENFAALWDQLNGTGAWHASPWVWVVEFKRIEAMAKAA